MEKIIIEIERNYMIYPLTGKIMVDGSFFDYIKASDKEKVMEVPDDAETISMKFGMWSSNEVKIKSLREGDKRIRVSSKIQNGFYLFAYALFTLGIINSIFIKEGSRFYVPYLSLALYVPYAMLAYWQTFHRKKLITLEKR